MDMQHTRPCARPSMVFEMASGHPRGVGGGLPLSGSELEFHELADPPLLAASSSYSYALGDLRAGREPPQPGDRGGFSLQRQCSSMEQACKLFGEAVLADNPMQCQRGYYKVMLFTGRNRYQPPPGDNPLTTSSSGPAASTSQPTGRDPASTRQSAGSDRGAKQPQQAVLEGLFFKQHNGVHYSVEDDTPIGDLARWLGVGPEVICRSNPGLKLKKGSRIPAGAAVHVPNVNCWSYQLDAGFTPVITDTDGRLVKDPRKASRKFGVLGSSDGLGVEYGVQFGSYCGAFCVRKEHVKTGES